MRFRRPYILLSLLLTTCELSSDLGSETVSSVEYESEHDALDWVPTCSEDGQTIALGRQRWRLGEAYPPALEVAEFRLHRLSISDPEWATLSTERQQRMRPLTAMSFEWNSREDLWSSEAGNLHVEYDELHQTFRVWGPSTSEHFNVSVEQLMQDVDWALEDGFDAIEIEMVFVDEASRVVVVRLSIHETLTGWQDVLLRWPGETPPRDEGATELVTTDASAARPEADTARPARVSVVALRTLVQRQLHAMARRLEAAYWLWILKVEDRVWFWDTGDQAWLLDERDVTNDGRVDEPTAMLRELVRTFERFAYDDEFDDTLADDQWRAMATFVDEDVGVLFGEDYYSLRDGEHVLGNRIVAGDALRELLPAGVWPLTWEVLHCDNGLCAGGNWTHVRNFYYVVQTTDDRYILAGVFLVDGLTGAEREAEIARSRTTWVDVIESRFRSPAPGPEHDE